MPGTPVFSTSEHRGCDLRNYSQSSRTTILVVCLFTALATPTVEVISMFLLAVSIVFRHLAAYFVAFLSDRRAERRVAALESSLAGS